MDTVRYAYLGLSISDYLLGGYSPDIPMTVTRKEPPNGGMTVEKYGQQFARDILLDRIRDVSEGDTVELDYRSPNGLEVSKVGTITELDRTDEHTDMFIHTGGPTDTCYLHVRTDRDNPNRGDVFFGDDSRQVGERTLLQFDPK